MKPEQFNHGWDKEVRGRWYVAIDDDRYLHIDGVVRYGTLNGDKYTGYFETERAAQEAIDNYRKQM